MNLHMPQDDMSEIELRELAAIPHNIVSPGTGKPIIGIFQDSLVGSTSFTRQDVDFDVKRAMNLLARQAHLDLSIFKRREGDVGRRVTNFEVLSQIMPPITLKYKTNAYKAYEDTPALAEANGILEIVAGRYVRGQLEKQTLGAKSKGLLHRIYQSCGKEACVDFIDDLQFIINEYMRVAGYSVGISDLIWNRKTQEQVEEKIADNKREVLSIIDQTHLGTFKNETNMTNHERLEQKIRDVLNQTTQSTGQIAQKTLGINNRFVFMSSHLAGSKGSETNIAQMIACLGQQDVYGQRVPYGYNNRSLPHFKKYDDSAEARGFVENSFIRGLNPSELFCHAITGRIGLIDTAVKTSETGYIQRRLIKAMEDIKVEWDMTVRNHKNKIVQFAYGGDSIDAMALESVPIEFMEMTVEQIYGHYLFADTKTEKSMLRTAFTSEAYARHRKQHETYKTHVKDVVKRVLDRRADIATNVMHDQFNDEKMMVSSPVHFKHTIEFVTNQAGINANTIIDITPLEVLQKVDLCYRRLTGDDSSFIRPNELFRLLFYHHLSPKQLLVKHHLNQATLHVLLSYIVLIFKKAVVAPGEMVGIISAQSVGEPTTQMTLNTFHSAGVASKTNVTTGLPRIQEVLKITESPAKPSMTIYMHKNDEHNKEAVAKTIKELEYVVLKDIVSRVSIYYDPNDANTVIDDDRLLLQQFREFSNVVMKAASSSPESTSDVQGANASDDTDDADKNNKWIVRIKMNERKMLDYNITMDDVYYVIRNGYRDFVYCIYSDYNSSDLVFRLRVDLVALRGKKKTKSLPLNASDEIHLLKTFQESVLVNTVLKGVKRIQKATVRRIPDSVDVVDGKYTRKEIWVMDTIGTNLNDVLTLDYIDRTRTITNDIHEVKRVLGIEAARQVIMNELIFAFSSGSAIPHHHLSLLVDRMTYNKDFVQIFRHGINKDNTGPIAKASFEETPQNFIEAAVYGMVDEMRGISANVMCGQEGLYGTNMSQILFDMNAVKDLEIDEEASGDPGAEETDDVDDAIREQFRDLDLDTKQDGACSKKQMAIHGTFGGFTTHAIDDDDDYDIDL